MTSSKNVVWSNIETVCSFELAGLVVSTICGVLQRFPPTFKISSDISVLIEVPQCVLAHSLRTTNIYCWKLNNFFFSTYISVGLWILNVIRIHNLIHLYTHLSIHLGISFVLQILSKMCKNIEGWVLVVHWGEHSQINHCLMEFAF